MKQHRTSILAAAAALALLSPFAGLGQSTNTSALVTNQTACLATSSVTNTVTNYQAHLAQSLKTATNLNLLASSSFKAGLSAACTNSGKTMDTNSFLLTADVKGRVLADGNLARHERVIGGMCPQTLRAPLDRTMAGSWNSDTNRLGTTRLGWTRSGLSPKSSA